MKIILGNDMVVHDMEGSFWETLEIILLLQEQIIGMELCLIHAILDIFLDFKCRYFFSPTIDGSSENKT